MVGKYLYIAGLDIFIYSVTDLLSIYTLFGIYRYSVNLSECSRNLSYLKTLLCCLPFFGYPLQLFKEPIVLEPDWMFEWAFERSRKLRNKEGVFHNMW